MPYIILHTEWSDGWGGQEQRIISEMSGMQTRGHQLLLATRPTARIANAARAAGIPVKLLPFRHRMDIPTVIALIRWVRQAGIQVINTHSSLDAWLGGIAAYWTQTPLIRTRHIDLPLKPHPFNFVRRHYVRVISCGEHIRQQLIHTSGFEPQQVVSIPTGIDFDTFKPRKNRKVIRAEWGFVETHYVIIMVGVLRSVKQHRIALLAFAQLIAQRPNARLVLVGEGPLFEATLQFSHLLGLQKHVLFLGHRNDVADLVHAADAMLLTSRSEGVPQALIQGLAAGLPVVATAAGGVTELIQDQQTGRCVPVGDVNAIAMALQSFADHPEWAASLGRNGQRHVHTQYGLQTMLMHTEQLYQELL